METFLCVPSGAPIPKTAAGGKADPLVVKVSQRENGQ